MSARATSLLGLAALSGFLSLTSEAAWLRWLDLQANDEPTSWLLTTLVFAIGGAMGAAIGSWRPQLLPFLELFQGLVAVATGWLVLDGFLYLTVPTPIACLFLIPAAIAIGAHAPLYARLLPATSFGRTQAVIAGAGIIGVFLFAIFAIGVIPLSSQLLILGIAEIVLAAMTFLAIRRADLGIEDSDQAPFLDGKFTWDELKAFSFGIFGLWAAAMAYRQITVEADVDRLGSVAIIMATLTAWTIGSLFGVRYHHRSSTFAAILLPAFPLGVILGQSLHWVLGAESSGFTSLLILWLVGALITLPSAASAAWLAASVRKSYSEGRSAGRLLAALAFGNAFGGVLAYVGGPAAAIGVAAIVAATLVMPWAQTKSLRARLFPAAGLTLVAALFFSGFMSPVWVRTRTVAPGTFGALVDHQLWSSGLNTFGLEDRRDEAGNIVQLLTINGHAQSGYGKPRKQELGMLAGRYFEAPLGNVLEIGAGSGQATFGLAAIARHVDAVDNDRQTIDIMTQTAERNGNVLADKSVNVEIADGINRVRGCRFGQYDAILITSDGPYVGSGLKFFGSEGIDAMKRCLSPNGILLNQFWADVVPDKAALDRLLAPYFRRFKHVDIHWYPYLAVVAYDADREQLEEMRDMPAIIGAKRDLVEQLADLGHFPKETVARHVTGSSDIPNTVNGGELERISRESYWQEMSGATVSDFRPIVNVIEGLPREEPVTTPSTVAKSGQPANHSKREE